jgi:hypothetical protein
MVANVHFSSYNPTKCWPIQQIPSTWTLNTGGKTFLLLRHQPTPMTACTLALKTLTSSNFNLRMMVLSSHTIFITTILNMLISKTSALTVSALWNPENYTLKHLIFYPVPSIALHWHLEQTLLFFWVYLNFSNSPPGFQNLTFMFQSCGRDISSASVCGLGRGLPLYTV